MLRTPSTHLGYLAAAVALWLGGIASAASAAPLLQIYIEGAAYDEATESWHLEPPRSEDEMSFRLWAIGKTAESPIEDVRLAAAYGAEYRTDADDLLLTLTGSTIDTDVFANFSDPSQPTDPVWLQDGSEETTPQLAPGHSLPSHGEYGPGTVWQEFALGDFTLADSPLGDFDGEVPTALKDDSAQINVYEVSVAFENGSPLPHGLRVHFDLYSYAPSRADAAFAPFSHDAEVVATPEPGTWAALLGIAGFGGLGFVRGYRRRKKAA